MTTSRLWIKRFEWYLAGKPEQKETEEGKTQGVPFWTSYDEFVKEQGRMNDWTPATYQKFNALKNHLNEELSSKGGESP